MQKGSPAAQFIITYIIKRAVIAERRLFGKLGADFFIVKKNNIMVR
ncbi:hypothetical protein BSI_22380 [Bacillus inaquosorum KCTC 13429]|uniref:Uncharacterized protein n=1 Tax=Bacillus inaquosorum KCTC 13429 TaxID=1236548 RepID=A0A9W5LHC7_9BACI|nr:hypothetical protein BSI_22380 [Bacillus inaquosorum KCTC 13429]